MAYNLTGSGPLIVLVPGMGDLRSTYRFLAPTLVASGFRVASMDLRGHGDSDTTFDSYGDDETAGDIAALIEHLGGPAVIVGNSMGAASAALLAADRPEIVDGLVLIGPFLRNGATTRLQKIAFRAAMTPVWAAVVWKAYLPKLYAGQRPTDFEAHRDDLVASLRRPGYAKAFSLTTHTNHDVAEACLSRVSTPVLVLMGEADPDFPDPAAEAAWIGQEMDAQVVMVPEAGHYPQSQRPDITTPAIIEFLAALPRHG